MIFFIIIFYNAYSIDLLFNPFCVLIKIFRIIATLCNLLLFFKLRLMNFCKCPGCIRKYDVFPIIGVQVDAEPCRGGRHGPPHPAQAMPPVACRGMSLWVPFTVTGRRQNCPMMQGDGSRA